MKIDLAYPKIPNNGSFPLKKCIAFEKYDGTNIHFVCKFFGDRQNGLAIIDEFGTRRDRFAFCNAGFEKFKKAHPGLEEVANWNFLNNYINYELEDYIFHKYIGTTNSVTIFAEFLGANSFAGQHNLLDEKQLVIFDIMVGNKLLPPQEFIDQYKQFNISKVVYEGKYSGQFVEDVRNGKYNVNEGVVCKGILDGQLYMAKIKTNSYMKRLQEKFKQNWEDYWE